MRRVVPENRLTGLGQAGLRSEQAASSLREFGPNQILPDRGGKWSVIIRDSLRDPMLWFLLVASALFWVVGERVEAAVLLLALIPLLGMDAWLHRRTQASVAGLGSRLAVQATVVRDGQSMSVPVEVLVPGDMVSVSAGEYLPADGIVLWCDSLQVDESTLTGEAFPVRKEPYLPKIAGQSIDEVHWGLAGTRVLTGEARLRVVWTGAETLYGEIVRSALAGTHSLTPLQQAVAHLVKILLFIAGGFCLVLAGLRLQQGYGIVDAILSAMTLAVAALPEEFPVVLAIFLGAGVYRLARRKALVRRAVVVENIGRVTCICSDKTGTLTEGRLELAHSLPAQHYDAALLLETAAAASRSDSNDPMDQALLQAATPPPAEALRACFPFTEDRRRETSLWATPDGLRVAVKGAPEIVLALCSLSEDEVDRWMRDVNDFAQSGHKVIACAAGKLDTVAWDGNEPVTGLTFSGVLAFEDPVREGVRESVQACRDAGIRVIMVTGDHPDTAAAIAREIGLGQDGLRLVTGEMLDAGADLNGIDLVARAMPAQKLKLVRSLQAGGEIVAVTGDGVNDVPALQAADVGIAMGERGSQSAREVAAIVLMDDNFRSIAGAVAEGRQLFANLQLSFQYLLMIHIPLVITAALIPMLGYPLLYLPIHIVLLELIIHPTALLVFQNVRTGRMPDRPPSTGARVRFFDAGQWWLVGAVGVLVTAMVSGAYLYALQAEYAVEHARSMAVLALVLAGSGITAALSGMRSGMAWVMVAVPPLALAMVLVQPELGELFHMEAPHVDDWLLVAGCGILTGLMVLWAQGLKRRSVAAHSLP
ncbi:MAG: cation-translocating P-type ATPase [Azoarcus sp.]|nr:cation-translocating P-type ATPase [Azoarcus sp.]